MPKLPLIGTVSIPRGRRAAMFVIGAAVTTFIGLAAIRFGRVGFNRLRVALGA